MTEYCDTCGQSVGGDATISETNRNVLNLMNEVLWEMRAAHRASKKKMKEDGDPLEARHNRLLGREIIAYAKSYSALAGELRKWEKQEAENVANYSDEQKLEVMLSMLEQFRPELRQRALHTLQRLCLPPGHEQEGELVE